MRKNVCENKKKKKKKKKKDVVRWLAVFCPSVGSAELADLYGKVGERVSEQGGEG